MLVCETLGHCVYKRLKPRLLSEKMEMWRFIGQLLDQWSQLYSTQQSFLCEVRDLF